MKTINATRARTNIYKLIDEANESNEPIQITGKRGNAIIISCLLYTSPSPRD